MDLLKNSCQHCQVVQKMGHLRSIFTITHTYDATEGPSFTFNQSWEWVFWCAESQKKYLIVRGKYGLDLVQAYIVHFAKIAGIEANHELSLLAQQVEALIALRDTMYFFNYMNNSPYNWWHHSRKGQEHSKMTTRPTNKKANLGKQTQLLWYRKNMYLNYSSWIVFRYVFS